MKAGYLSGVIVGGVIGAAVMFFALPYLKPGINKAVRNGREFIDETMSKGQEFIDEKLSRMQQ